MKYLILSILFVTGCASKSDIPKGADIGERLTPSKYEKLLEKHTRNDKQYNGFYNTFQVHTTMVNSELQSALLQKESDALLWDDKTAQQAREKAFQEMSSESKFMLSLFTPERKHNDLHKGASIWKIYLEFEGKRYEGRATRKELKLMQLQSMLPHHTRWSTTYEVTFKIPMTAIEKGESRFIITSTLGTSEFKFKPL